MRFVLFLDGFLNNFSMNSFIINIIFIIKQRVITHQYQFFCPLA